MRSPVESRPDASDPGILLTFFCFLLTVITSADYCSCAAAFCSPRLCRRRSAFSCFALPRRNRSTTSTALGRQPEYLDDQLLGCFLSLVHASALLLGRLSVSVCPDWSGLWRHSRLGRFGDDALGKPTGRTFLHPKPLARASHHVGDRRTFHLRLVARHALRQQCSGRSALVNHRLRHAAFPGSRCRIDRLLSGVLRWSASATHETRTTATQLERIRKAGTQEIHVHRGPRNSIWKPGMMNQESRARAKQSDSCRITLFSCFLASWFPDSIATDSWISCLPNSFFSNRLCVRSPRRFADRRRQVPTPAFCPLCQMTACCHFAI